MDTRAALKGQYHAAMAMLRDAVETCPDGLWASSDDRVSQIAYWRVVYHTIFFTHFYLQDHVDAFVPWPKHRGEDHCFGPPPWAPDRPPKIGPPYSKAEMLDYWKIVDGLVDERLDAMNLDSADCGFPWYRLNKLEHQLNNIRHIQHHAAVLAARLRANAGIDIHWRGSA